MLQVHFSLRCRLPRQGTVQLSELHVNTDRESFTLQGEHFRLDPAPNPRVLYAGDARNPAGTRGIRLRLRADTRKMVTSAVWRVAPAGRPAFRARHVVEWLLPPDLAGGGLLSDELRLWPPFSTPVPLTPGDWPVMDIDSDTLKRPSRWLTTINSRNDMGLITHRFQTFPLALLPRDTRSPLLTDWITIPPLQQTSPFLK